ncbi:hypothetical protein EHR01_06510 [Leptospira mtsangambouensis]|uniref:Uncharacterized protein n=1 Tax=Leptospira mtsangambouensis TaxID=2484912 RepID=A0ABY2P4W4_9LEPT|nr:hypothetical protein [Leptospira mtsangambouensis]TGM82427.1 hypothetical protein EHR01_06510 [Leptospira mtsangambouensis]
MKVLAVEKVKKYGKNTMAKTTSHNSIFPLRFGTRPHSACGKFPSVTLLAPQEGAPTPTPPAEARLQGTSGRLVRYAKLQGETRFLFGM